MSLFGKLTWRGGTLQAPQMAKETHWQLQCARFRSLLVGNRPTSKILFDCNDKLLKRSSLKQYMNVLSGSLGVLSTALLTCKRAAAKVKALDLCQEAVARSYFWRPCSKTGTTGGKYGPLILGPHIPIVNTKRAYEPNYGILRAQK